MAADIVVNTFRVGPEAGGNTALSTWMDAQVTAGFVHLLAVKTYTRGADLYVIAAMGTVTTGPTNPVGTFVAAADFELADAGAAPLAAWLNLQVTTNSIKYLQALNIEQTFDGRIVRVHAVVTI